MARTSQGSWMRLPLVCVGVVALGVGTFSGASDKEAEGFLPLYARQMPGVTDLVLIYQGGAHRLPWKPAHFEPYVSCREAHADKEQWLFDGSNSRTSCPVSALMRGARNSMVCRWPNGRNGNVGGSSVPVLERRATGSVRGVVRFPRPARSAGAAEPNRETRGGGCATERRVVKRCPAGEEAALWPGRTA